MYLYNVRYRAWGAAGDTIPAQLLPLALKRNHAFVFDGLVPPGARGHWFTERNGHIVSSYPILPGLFNVPTYLIAMRAGLEVDAPRRALLSVITASVVTAASAALFFLAVSRLVARLSTALGAALAYGLATTAASVAARGLWQHGPSLLFLSAALWMLTHEGKPWIALAGLPLGLAIWNRPLDALLVAPIVLSVLASDRRSLLGLAGVMAIPLALMGWYSWAYWGSLLFLGQYSPEGMFSGHAVEGLLGLLFSPSRGLFVFTPLFLFGLPTAVRALRHPARRPLLAALAIGPLLQLLVYSKWFSWWGGYTFGYRLLTSWVPGLTVLVAVGWERSLSRRRAATAGVGAAFAWSLYVNQLGAFYYPCGFNSMPNDIEKHTERLWDVRDGEIARCTAKAAAQIRSRLAREPSAGARSRP